MGPCTHGGDAECPAAPGCGDFGSIAERLCQWHGLGIGFGRGFAGAEVPFSLLCKL